VTNLQKNNFILIQKTLDLFIDINTLDKSMLNSMLNDLGFYLVKTRVSLKTEYYELYNKQSCKINNAYIFGVFPRLKIKRVKANIPVFLTQAHFIHEADQDNED